jgi:hypothetical protein
MESAFVEVDNQKHMIQNGANIYRKMINHI